jgi:hypothetical protein
MQIIINYFKSLTLFDIIVICMSTLSSIISLIHFITGKIYIKRLIRLFIYIAIWTIIPVTIWLYIINNYNLRIVQIWCAIVLIEVIYFLCFFPLLGLKVLILCTKDWLKGGYMFENAEDYFCIFKD